jgi:hypothetical protein
MAGRRQLGSAPGEEPAHVRPLADEADGEGHEDGLLLAARRVGEEERRFGKEPGKRGDEGLAIGRPRMRGAQDLEVVLAGALWGSGACALEERRDVDLDREGADRPAVLRERFRVGPRLDHVVGPGKGNPRHFDEVVVLRGAPENG